eukprot:1189711-Prorocentrum_minimum.AAC.1
MSNPIHGASLLRFTIKRESSHLRGRVFLFPLGAVRLPLLLRPVLLLLIIVLVRSGHRVEVDVARVLEKVVLEPALVVALLLVVLQTTARSHTVSHTVSTQSGTHNAGLSGTPT